MTGTLDPRLHAFRPDLAEARLRGRVEAERFVEGEPAGLAVGWTDLKRRPEAAAPNDSQLLFGEKVTVFERRRRRATASRRCARRACPAPT